MRPALKLITGSVREPALIPEFVDAMSKLASGVVLVTSWLADRPWGMTVTAFASVSVEPPTILVSLGSATASSRAIGLTQRFGVSILAADQIPVARLGAEPGAAKFLDAFVDRGETGSHSPVVTGALAHLDAEVAEAVQVADHTIFVGRVRAAVASGGGMPLLYHRRGYRTTGDPDAGRRAPDRRITCLSS